MQSELKRRSWNRRDFVTAASLSAAALSAGASVSIGAEQAETELQPLTVGLLGATHTHAMEKLAVLRSAPAYKLVGVCEESAKARPAIERQGISLLSRDELFERCAIIVVESAVRDHARDALLALRAGKHVHVEKPPASTLDQVQEMVSLAQTRHLVLQTGYMWRYHPGFMTLFEAARKGWLGEIFLVRGAISNFLAPVRRPQWGEFKGGSMFDLGSHLIDAAARLLGKPQRVTPFLHRHGKGADQLNDNNVAVLEYETAVAVITNTALQPTEMPERSFEVLGSNGSALLTPIEPPVLQLEFVKAAGPYRKGLQKIPLPDYRRHVADLEALAAAVRGQAPLTVTLEEELAVQETLLKACGML